MVAKTNLRELRRRARANVAERRRQQDRLIVAAVGAVAARREAADALVAAESSLAEAVGALAEIGVDHDQLATLLHVPAHRLGGRGVGHRSRGGSGRAGPMTAPQVKPAGVAYAAGEEGGAIRVWLAMIERGPSPKTHSLDQDGGLLCRGKGDPGELTTWIGYPFDVDCGRCVKLLSEELTEEEFG